MNGASVIKPAIGVNEFRILKQSRIACPGGTC